MNIFYKNWAIVEILLILICISFYIDYSKSVNEDKQLEEKFNYEHKAERLKSQNQRYRAEYDQNVAEAQNDFYYQLEYLEINYKRDIGELTLDEWSDKISEMVREQVKDGKADLDSYFAALDEIKVIEYVTPDELSGRIKRSKLLSRVSLALVLATGVVIIIKHW